jgi:hypothetical protein
MSTLPKKSRGGPKTVRGKQASSQNSLVHGATSNKITNSEQGTLVDAHVQELIAYYNPESPLEKLQIQRIALCKAKLDSLYDLEQVKLQIAEEDLKRAPELVMEKIGAGDGLARAFAETIFNGYELELPMGLTPDSLRVYASEINAVGGQLELDDDLNLALPSLGRFINEVAHKRGSTPHRELLRIGQALNGMLQERGVLEYQLSQVLRSLKKAKQEEAYGESLSDANKSELNEEPDLNKIQEALNGITRLNSAVINAHELARNFKRMQDLMLRSVTLGGEESDRLLRYQTTWERRLSSAIGELLALQAKNSQ